MQHIHLANFENLVVHEGPIDIAPGIGPVAVRAVPIRHPTNRADIDTRLSLHYVPISSDVDDNTLWVHPLGDAAVHAEESLIVRESESRPQATADAEVAQVLRFRVELFIGGVVLWRMRKHSKQRKKARFFVRPVRLRKRSALRM
jgi:hypothetical protein